MPNLQFPSDERKELGLPDNHHMGDDVPMYALAEGKSRGYGKGHICREHMEKVLEYFEAPQEEVEKPNKELICQGRMVTSPMLCVAPGGCAARVKVGDWYWCELGNERRTRPFCRKCAIKRGAIDGSIKPESRQEYPCDFADGPIDTKSVRKIDTKSVRKVYADYTRWCEAFGDSSSNALYGHTQKCWDQMYKATPSVEHPHPCKCGGRTNKHRKYAMKREPREAWPLHLVGGITTNAPADGAEPLTCDTIRKAVASIEDTELPKFWKGHIHIDLGEQPNNSRKQRGKGVLMSVVNTIKQLHKSADQKLLEEYRVLDDRGNVTGEGMEAVAQIILEDSKSPIRAALIDSLKKDKKERKDG